MLEFWGQSRLLWRKRHEDDCFAVAWWDGIFLDHCTGAHRVSSTWEVQCCHRKYSIVQTWWNLAHWPEDQVHICKHAFNKFRPQQPADCCTMHPYTSQQPGLNEGCAFPAQSHTQYSALTIYRRTSEISTWHKGRWVFAFCEWEIGLGERVWSTSRLRGKKFLNLRGDLLKPSSSTLTGMHMW